MSESPFIFAKWALRLGAVAFFGVDGMAVEAAAEGVASLAKDLWEKYLAKRTPQERCRDIEVLAQAEAAEVIEAVREELQAIPDAAARSAAEAFAAALPGQLRASLRSAADPSGRTVPPALIPQNAEDVLRLLPQRPPRFRAGDRPAGIGDWELVELLGTGGFGEVWKARNPHMSSQAAALKFCLDAKAAASLRREASLLNRVATLSQQTSGIVRILGTALNAEPPCVIYELVEGGTLAGRIRERQGEGKPFSAEEAARLILELAETMAVCHGAQPPIVHRDLKPANILVEALTGRLRIADFGIGDIAGENLSGKAGGVSLAQRSLATASGSHTPLYASPQQMRGLPADVRDDVHALGIIWWQMLCGDLSSGAPSGRWMQKLEAAGHPPALVHVLAECLDPDVCDRVASATVLVERLYAALPSRTPATANPVDRPGTALRDRRFLKIDLPRVAKNPSPGGTLLPKRPLTVEGLAQDPFETPEEYAGSLAAQGAVEAGRFAFVKQDYDIHQQLYRLPQNITWAEFMQPQHRPMGGLLLKADRDLAVQAYANGAQQPLFVRLAPNGKTHSVNKFSIVIGGQHHALLDAALESRKGTLREIIAAMVPIPPDAGRRAPFAMCKYAVTQGWYETITGRNPSQFKGDARLPVEQVSWNDAKAFCQQLNELCARSNLHTGRRFALPTEAQWKRACRAGSKGDFGLLANGKEGTVDEMAWYDGNSGSTTHLVGQKAPNAWDLYDMHGNVWEWCEDVYEASRSYRVFRGGSWGHNPSCCAAGFRNSRDPDGRGNSLGFRLASVPV